LDAAPIPPKKPSGTEITSAQGQETTKKVHALSNQIRKLSWNKIGGTTANMSAEIVTNGV
jgi:hypothetical protein